VDLAAQPTNSGNGKATNLDGQITSLSTNTSSFNVSAGDGVSWSIATNGGTVFQGISGLSALVPGMAVDVDAALQDDGTLLATRIAVTITDISSEGASPPTQSPSPPTTRFRFWPSSPVRPRCCKHQATSSSTPTTAASVWSCLSGTRRGDADLSKRRSARENSYRLSYSTAAGGRSSRASAIGAS